MRKRKNLLVGLLLGIAAIAGLLTAMDYKAAWRWMSVPAPDAPFMDVTVIAAATDAYRHGLDPMEGNPSDVAGRRLNYPRIWQTLCRLGFGGGDVDWFGVVSGALFFIAVAIVTPPLGRRDAAWMTAAVFFPAVLLGLERGNTDLLMFFLLALALVTGSRHAVWAWLLVMAAFALKLYPLLGMAVLLGGGAKGGDHRFGGGRCHGVALLALQFGRPGAHQERHAAGLLAVLRRGRALAADQGSKCPGRFPGPLAELGRRLCGDWGKRVETAEPAQCGRRPGDGRLQGRGGLLCGHVRCARHQLQLSPDVSALRHAPTPGMGRQPGFRPVRLARFGLGGIYVSLWAAGIERLLPATPGASWVGFLIAEAGRWTAFGVLTWLVFPHASGLAAFARRNKRPAAGGGNPAGPMKALFVWLDTHPAAYWWIGGAATVLFLAWVRLAWRYAGDRDKGWRKGDNATLALLLLLLLAWRWPALFETTKVGLAEVAVARGCARDSSRRSAVSRIDLGENGWLSAALLLPTHGLGIPQDYFNGRLVALLLDWGTLAVGYGVFAQSFGRGGSRQWACCRLPWCWRLPACPRSSSIRMASGLACSPSRREGCCGRSTTNRMLCRDTGWLPFLVFAPFPGRSGTDCGWPEDFGLAWAGWHGGAPGRERRTFGGFCGPGWLRCISMLRCCACGTVSDKESDLDELWFERDARQLGGGGSRPRVLLVRVAGAGAALCRLGVRSGFDGAPGGGGGFGTGRSRVGRSRAGRDACYRRAFFRRTGNSLTANWAHGSGSCGEPAIPWSCGAAGRKLYVETGLRPAVTSAVSVGGNHGGRSGACAFPEALPGGIHGGPAAVFSSMPGWLDRLAAKIGPDPGMKSFRSWRSTLRTITGWRVMTDRQGLPAVCPVGGDAGRPSAGDCPEVVEGPGGAGDGRPHGDR